MKKERKEENRRREECLPSNISAWYQQCITISAWCNSSHSRLFFNITPKVDKSQNFKQASPSIPKVRADAGHWLCKIILTFIFFGINQPDTNQILAWISLGWCTIYTNANKLDDHQSMKYCKRRIVRHVTRHVPYCFYTLGGPCLPKKFKNLQKKIPTYYKQIYHKMRGFGSIFRTENPNFLEFGQGRRKEWYLGSSFFCQISFILVK